MKHPSQQSPSEFIAQAISLLLKIYYKGISARKVNENGANKIPLRQNYLPEDFKGK